MKKILIISATSGSNFKLGKEIISYIDSNRYQVKIINLEDFILPLFNPSTFEKDKKIHYSKIIKLTDMMVEASAFILCSPEYNGNVPPVVSNAIAWISTTTDYWKDAFKDKNIFISSSSGGEAKKFQIAMENQLNHLGSIVYQKKIIVNSNHINNHNISKKIINDFIKLL